jgi:drug/metabolite transporter (DMT)-like permease
MVLLNAPPVGDASLKGNVLGFIAMLLLVGYVVSTRYYRQDMDVAVFMATICPIGALAVLPVAVVTEGGLGMSSTGWTYMLILTFLSGVAANGLLVYAQKTIQIGTISISQVVQPAVAVVWSFLLLGETVEVEQAVGITIAMGGLAAFLWLNQRGEQRRQAKRRDVAPTPEARLGSAAT